MLIVQDLITLKLIRFQAIPYSPQSHWLKGISVVFSFALTEFAEQEAPFDA